MKDKLIEKKLNLYVEAVKPQSSVITSAVFELRQIQSQKIQSYPAKRKTGMIFGISAAAAASFAIFIFLTITIVNMISGPPNYALSELTYKTATISEIKSTASILTLNISDSYTNGRIYYRENSSEPVVVSILYKTVGSGGLDEIIVIADLNNGLKDYSNFKNYKQISVGGIAVFERRIYVNGEYYTEVFFSYEDVDYYVIVTSPMQDNAGQYILLLLNT